MVLVPRSLYFHESGKSQTCGKSQKLYIMKAGTQISLGEEISLFGKISSYELLEEYIMDLKSWLSICSDDSDERTLPERREGEERTREAVFDSSLLGWWLKDCRSWHI